MKLLVAAVVLLVAASSAPACSIFKYAADGRVYFCANEDWTATDPAIMTGSPRGRDYGWVVLGWKSFLPRYIQAGVNSKGLCFDWAAVPPQPYARSGGNDGELTLDFTLDLLTKCATVDEAIGFIKAHAIPHLAEEHIMLADRSGKSCIVEYHHSQLRVVEDTSGVQLMTNFHVTDPSLGWYPCARFARMETFFRERGNKEARLAELLDGVHQEGPYPTVYSYIFDLGGGTISMFYNHTYAQRKVFSLDALTRRDQLIDIVPLFHQR